MRTPGKQHSRLEYLARLEYLEDRIDKIKGSLMRAITDGRWRLGPSRSETVILPTKESVGVIQRGLSPGPGVRTLNARHNLKAEIERAVKDGTI